VMVPAHTVKATVLDGPALDRAWRRIAHEVIERQPHLDQLVLVGIVSRGVPLAARLARLLQELEGVAVPIVPLDVRAYRDDLPRTTVRPLKRLGVQAKPKRGIMKFLKNRLMSFSMIGTAGFLLLVGLIINSLMDVLNNRLIAWLPALNINFYYTINTIILFVIITILFTMIFKTLPDGKVVLRDCIIGAAFTAVLFMLGKFAIGAYLGSSAIASVYGAAGSVILILVWVYYSAIILYFGAEFTKVYAHTHGKKIIPNKYSIRIEKIKN